MPRICITVEGETPQPYRFDLDRKKISIGRASENDIQIGCGSVSTNHAVIRRVDGGYVGKDLDSTNGVKFDEREVTLIDLNQSKVFKVGDVEVDFELSKDELAILDKEGFESVERAKLPPIKKSKSETVQLKEASAESEEQEDRERKEEDVEPAPRRSRRAVAAGASGLREGFYMLLMVALAAGAFFLGLSKRHMEKTGRSLLDDLKSGGDAASEVNKSSES